jgi:hypothetical protein
LQEEALVAALSTDLRRTLPAQAQVVVPMTIGGHVDHLFTRTAVERLARPFWYYSDYPYVLRYPSLLNELHQAGWQADHFPVSPGGVSAWAGAVAAHVSQISTFWPDVTAMTAAIQEYAGSPAGVTLWRQMPVKCSTE